MTSRSAEFLTKLHSLLDLHFDLVEMRELCFELHVDYDSLRGEGKSARMRELILGLARQDRLLELVSKAEEKRQRVEWPAVPEQFGLPASVYLATAESAQPQLRFEPETLLVPAGPFLMGNDEDPLASPEQRIELTDYIIGIYPVTNEQFAHYVWQTGQVAANELLWDGNEPRANQLRHPVTGVTWIEAMNYCQWLSDQTGKHYTLPSEAQWEKAARGTDGRLYPWGNEWNPAHCNINPDTITAVDAFPPQSPYGIYDMVGNAREWTTTMWGTVSREPDDRYRYPWVEDGRDDPGAPPTTWRIYRGGRFRNSAEFRCSVRRGHPPTDCGPKRNRHGFRVVLLIEDFHGT